MCGGKSTITGNPIADCPQWSDHDAAHIDNGDGTLGAGFVGSSGKGNKFEEKLAEMMQSMLEQTKQQ